MQNKVRAAIQKNDELSSYKIDIEVNEDRVVYLKGDVDSWQHVVDIGHIAANVGSVYNVVNDITAKGVKMSKADYSNLIQEGKEIGVIDECDVVIVGGGVIGCGIARELSKYQLKISVVEKEQYVSEGTSKANNGMIHPGNAAHPATLKAKLNVKGNAMYTDWANELGFAFKRTGSTILAYNEDDMKTLELANMAGKMNRVPHMKKISGKEVMELEPTLKQEPLLGLYTPSTAYVEGYDVTIALAENAAMNGVKFYLNTQVVDVITENGKVEGVVTQKGIIKATYVINCAGVYADDLAEMAGDKFFTIHPRKGAIIIFDKSKKGVLRATNASNEKRNKDSKGGGAQSTPEGNALWGPSALDVPSKEDTGVSKEEFDYAFSCGTNVNEDIKKEDVITYFSGLRAADYKEDFIIGMSKKVNGFINVAGIQSPGLAAAPAIAEMVERIILKDSKKMEKNPHFNPIRKPIVDFRNLSFEDQDQMIQENPLYGNIICRCETITEGEIVAAIHAPIPVTTVDGIKRRVRAGMGRCQGGFCSSKILEILARELDKDITEITLNGKGSRIIDRKSRMEETL